MLRDRRSQVNCFFCENLTDDRERQCAGMIKSDRKLLVSRETFAFLNHNWAIESDILSMEYDMGYCCDCAMAGLSATR